MLRRLKFVLKWTLAQFLYVSGLFTLLARRRLRGRAVV